MPFPVDPNAPGGPRRSEHLRSCFAARSASPKTEIAVPLKFTARVGVSPEPRWPCVRRAA